MAAGRNLALPGQAQLDRRISRDDMSLGSRRPLAAASDKRISRDDLYLGTRAAAATSGARNANFRAPYRGRLPTPEESPSFEDSLMPLSPPVRMASPESFMSGEIQIGMALGSPAHPPPAMQQQQQLPSSAGGLLTPVEFQMQQRPVVPAGTSEIAPVALPQQEKTAGAPTGPSPPSGDSLQRSKTTRRKLFGLFGSRRHQDHSPKAASSTATAASPSTASSQEAHANESPSASLSTATSISVTVQSPAAAPPPLVRAQTAQPLSTLESTATRSGNKKYQPIVPAEPQALPQSTGATITTTVSATAPTSKPFSRSKTSEPVSRLRPEISRPVLISGGKSVDMDNAFPVPDAATASATASAAGGPLGNYFLNVEIPEARLERYSVMFEELLSNGCSQPAASLLARRQATLDRLKMINGRALHGGDDALLRGRGPAEASSLLQVAAGGPAATTATSGFRLQRRATSPQPLSSPSHMLFPSASLNNGDRKLKKKTYGGAELPSPRFRSNTSPALSAATSPWPSRPQGQALYDTQQQQYMPNPLQENPFPSSMLNRQYLKRSASAATPSSSSGSHPLRAAVYYDASQQQLHQQPLPSVILESPTEMMGSPRFAGEGEEEVDVVVQSLRPALREPTWQMVSPPPVAALSTESPRSASHSNGSGKDDIGAAKGSHPTTEPIDPEESERILNSAVELSIARQISVSRQQREMLRPLQVAMGGPSAGAASSASAANSSVERSATLRLARNERLQDIRTATPTLVLADTMATRQYTTTSTAAATTAGTASGGQPVLLQPTAYQAPRINTVNTNNLHTYQVAQNRKSEMVILEAA